MNIAGIIVIILSILAIIYGVCKVIADTIIEYLPEKKKLSRLPR